ncbi:MAG: response regulator [Candidatus Aminicenantales bacterium]
MATKKIIVVDDEESIRKTFFLILSKTYKVHLAKDGAEALARYKNAAVDLIIADYRLPDMNGVELVEALRRAGYGGEVILISAFADLIEPDVLSRLKISHFFAKPLDLDALNRSIDYLLRKDELNAGRPA